MPLRPLKAAVIVKDRPAAFQREARPMGMWSYPVPAFTWEFLTLGKQFRLNTVDFKRKGFDFIFHEDGGSWGDYVNSAIPVIYYAIDSTLSDEHHFKPRLEQARRADLVLVDHDHLERFTGCRQVRRLSYCVNDTIFYPRPPRNLDLVFHCNGSENGRGTIRRLLHDIAQRQHLSYVSGAVDLQTYADHLGRGKLIINWPRVPGNRPHRVLDALASGGCLLSGPLPAVSGEDYEAGLHYLPIDTPQSLEKAILSALQDKQWESIGGSGLSHALSLHTWNVRAEELRTMIHDLFGI